MGNPTSPVHYSPESGVHLDRHLSGGKVHVPYSGQTTIQTFSDPSYSNDRHLSDLGGSPTSWDYIGSGR